MIVQTLCVSMPEHVKSLPSTVCSIWVIHMHVHVCRFAVSVHGMTTQCANTVVPASTCTCIQENSDSDDLWHPTPLLDPAFLPSCTGAWFEEHPGHTIRRYNELNIVIFNCVILLEYVVIWDCIVLLVFPCCTSVLFIRYRRALHPSMWTFRTTGILRLLVRERLA